jgi:peptidoglycan biosynthesis protein MviN/MurJ (putative lipid II flippase)
LGERGLAVSTALVAMLQAGWLAVLFDRGIAPLPWRELATTIIKSGLATLAMAATVWPWLERQPAGSPFWSLAVAVPLGLAVYLGVCRLLGMREVAVVLVGATPNEQGDVARAPAA